MEQVEIQLKRFRKGFSPLSISRPAVVGEGIKRLSPEEIDLHTSKYEQADVTVLKFVPSSGAASRMFKSLFSFISRFQGTVESYINITREEKSIDIFFEGLNDFAFYEELESIVVEKLGKGVAEAKTDGLQSEILNLLLTDKGLNYGSLPKGLLKFHRYKNQTRTAAQEHLHEGLAYAGKKGELRLHFTVSPEHLNLFKEHIETSIRKVQSSMEVHASYSIQEPWTDTLASNLTFEPFRKNDGELLFRPAGHGALLENLNNLSEDLIFIKNIDNVVPDSIKAQTIQFKKALGGILLLFQEKTFDLLNKNDRGEDIIERGRALLHDMGVKRFTDEEVVSLLNRPIRVCGMVKNEGEPGGGPFWVRNGNVESLQIVESSQIDSNNLEQHDIFKKGTHFNPVDLVCGIKDYQGKKFDLMGYRDNETGFISKKSFDGDNLLAMELPGLWNGSMADWNTIFVEVPLITFNPVKTVTDLLKPTHR